MPLSSALGVFADVGEYWKNRAYNWWHQGKPLDTLLQALHDAKMYEEWEAIAYQLDEHLHTDLWRQNASSKYYDYRLMHERRQAIIQAREEEDTLGLVNLLRSGLVRNLGNITSPKLYNRAYAGTKLLIEEYITQVALAIEYVTALPTTQSYEPGWTSQAKLDLLHDTRQAFGRSTLVLQGGGIFALCHLGVVKALHLRGLLPRIITGTSTGALIAALIATHTEDELLDFLNGKGIDLTALKKASDKNDDTSSTLSSLSTVQNFLWSTVRIVRGEPFYDTSLLEDAVRENVGELTFEEAYARTKRVLNITIPTSGRGGVPNLLNYLTAPNVLISSAALASNTSTSNTTSSPLTLLCKDETGAITPWSSSSPSHLYQQPHVPTYTLNERDSPLSRVAELFNVNHFIVSQARPFLSPFLRSSSSSSTSDTTISATNTSSRSASLPHQSRRHSSWSSLLVPMLRLATQEVHHRLNQLDALGLLPSTLRRLLIDESIPPGASITLVPDLTLHDLAYVMLRPHPANAAAGASVTIDDLAYWVTIGERAVWPNTCVLRIRCAVEVELDRCYQLVRRRKPLDAMGGLVLPSSSSSADRK